MADMKSKISDPNIPRPKLKYPANFSVEPKKAVATKKPTVVPRSRGQSTSATNSPVRVVHAKKIITKLDAESPLKASSVNSSEPSTPFPRSTRNIGTVERSPKVRKRAGEESKTEPTKTLLPETPKNRTQSLTTPTSVSTAQTSHANKGTSVGAPSLSESIVSPKEPPVKEFKTQPELKANTNEAESKTHDISNRKELIKIDAESQNLMRASVQLQQQSEILKKNAELENVVVKLRAESKESNDRIKTLKIENKELKDRFATNANMVSELTQQNTE